MAKYYTSLLGSKEQGSVNAYMYVDSNGGGNNTNPGEKKRKKKQKKKRATSHAISDKPMRGVESQKNLLAMESDGLEGQPGGYQASTNSIVDTNNRQNAASEEHEKGESN